LQTIVDRQRDRTHSAISRGGFAPGASHSVEVEKSFTSRCCSLVVAEFAAHQVLADAGHLHADSTTSQCYSIRQEAPSSGTQQAERKDRAFVRVDALCRLQHFVFAQHTCGTHPWQEIARGNVEMFMSRCAPELRRSTSPGFGVSISSVSKAPDASSPIKAAVLSARSEIGKLRALL